MSESNRLRVQICTWSVSLFSLNSRLVVPKDLQNNIRAILDTEMAFG